MITNKYLDTLFNPKYFSKEAIDNASNKVFHLIPFDDEIDSSFNELTIISSGNRYLIKTEDKINIGLDNGSDISIDDKRYLINNLKDRIDGTCEIVLELRE